MNNNKYDKRGEKCGTKVSNHVEQNKKHDNKCDKSIENNDVKKCCKTSGNYKDHHGKAHHHASKNRAEKYGHSCHCPHDHENEMTCGCSCGHESGLSKQKILTYVIGGLLLLISIIGELGEMTPWASVPSALLVYLYFGRSVWRGAIDDIGRKRYFTEFTLMCFAGLGALVLFEFTEAAAVIYLYSLGEGISGEAYNRSKKSISSLIEITEDNVTVVVGGSSKIVSASEAQVGDILSIRVGDRISLDGVVVSGNGFADTSSINGESVPRELYKGVECLSGFTLVSGAVYIRVTKKYSESTASKLKEAVERASSEKAVTEKRITNFAAIFTPIAFGVAVFVLILGIFLKDSFAEAVKSALMVLVVSCPCSLVLSVPLTYFSGVGRAAKRGIVFRSGQTIDNVTALKTLIFDKTGTLTSSTPEFLGVVMAKKSPIDKKILLDMSKSALLKSPHASARSFCSAYTAGVSYSVENVKNIGGMGLVCVVGGNKALFGNKRLMENAGVKIKEVEMSAIYVSVEGVYCGALVFGSKAKPGALAHVSRIRGCGIERVVIMSGDNKASVTRLAHEVAVEEYYWELKPHEKLEMFNNIYKEEKAQNPRRTVGFCGDGLNDSAVIAKADVGIAMGSGSSLTVESADAVIVDDSLERLGEMLLVAKSTRRVATQNIALSLGVKVAVILLGMFGFYSLGLAVVADVGTAVVTVLNATRAGNSKKVIKYI